MTAGVAQATMKKTVARKVKRQLTVGEERRGEGGSESASQVRTQRLQARFLHSCNTQRHLHSVRGHLQLD